MKQIQLFGILMLTLMAACQSPKRLMTTEPPVLNDTLIENTIIVERWRIDTLLVEVPIPAQSEKIITFDGSSHLETDFALSDAWVNPDGSLGHWLRNKLTSYGAQVSVPVKDTQSAKIREVVREIPVEVPTPYPVEKELTLMQQIKINSFWYLVGFLCICVLFVFQKPLLKLFKV